MISSIAFLALFRINLAKTASGGINDAIVNIVIYVPYSVSGAVLDAMTSSVCRLLDSLTRHISISIHVSIITHISCLQDTTKTATLVFVAAV
jgi:hypothetical protein